MSRIAKIPVQIVQGVSYTLTADNITVKGPQGEVSMHILPFVTITEEDGALHFKQVEETREANANVGTMRALVADMSRVVPLASRRSFSSSAWAIVPRLRATSSISPSASPTRSSIRCPLVSSAKRRARLKF